MREYDVPAPSPWVDAAEKPRPCELCVVEWRKDGGWRGYVVLYWDALRAIWRSQDGVDFTPAYQKCARWQYLNMPSTEA